MILGSAKLALPGGNPHAVVARLCRGSLVVGQNSNARAWGPTELPSRICGGRPKDRRGTCLHVEPWSYCKFNMIRHPKLLTKLRWLGLAAQPAPPERPP